MYIPIEGYPRKGTYLFLVKYTPPYVTFIRKKYYTVRGCIPGRIRVHVIYTFIIFVNTPAPRNVHYLFCITRN